MARPKGTVGDYVVAPKSTPPRRLLCDACTYHVDLRVNDDPTHGDGWPLHKCRSTGKARAFDRVVDVPPIPVRHWDDAAVDKIVEGLIG